MKKKSKVLSLFFAGFMILAFFSQAGAQQPQEAPGFTLQDIKGELTSLSNYKEKNPVVLFFWTTWCPYCLTQIRVMNKIYPRIREEGIEILAINLKEPALRVERFAKKYDIKYPVLLDSNTYAAYAYAVLGIPTYILVNKKGEIVFEDNYFPEGEYKGLLEVK